MAWLRPILLLAGTVFIGLLIWWERRRPRRAQQGSEARAARSTPSFGPVGESEVGQGTEVAGEHGSRDRELRRAPPVINWSVEALPARVSQENAKAEPAAPGAGAGAGAGADAVAPSPVAAPEPAPLVVAWPPEDQRSIVTLRLLPTGAERLAGRALRLGLTACGFRHGQFDIFHLPGGDGRVVLSAASLVRPGCLDPAAMDQQRFAGLNLFAVLPGPMSAETTLQLLGQVALELSARVGGCVQDEHSAPFTPADAAAWRRRRLGLLGTAPVRAMPGGAAPGGAAGLAD